MPTGETHSLGMVPLLLLMAALAAAALCVIAEQSTPAPLGRDVGPEVYSAARAADHLRELLGEGEPHPVGSAANARVRARLVNLLERYGLDVTEQQAVGCGFGTCGRVHNVLAEIPGRGQGAGPVQPPALLLMAHYDSVPAAPGAGDDGAGVAALIEVARILMIDAPYRNRVLFAFTDGEEVALLGAEALFRAHPWAERVEAVINLEGSGSSGAVNLLRVGPSSGALVRTFQEVSRFPVAASVMQVLFELMPNNTDFMHAMQAGVPGIDFAFAGDRLHYHTPLDSIGNLHRGTLQHHGDNVLPLARRLADADLTLRADNFAYVTIANRWWVTWPVGASVPLAVAVLVLLAGAGVLARRSLGWRQLLGGVALALGVLVAVAALELAVWAILDRLLGTRVTWPAYPWPWRLVSYAGAAAAALAVGWLCPPRLGFWGRHLGGWLVWAALALSVAAVAPLAANVLLVPALTAAVATVLLAAPRVRERPLVRYAGAALCLFVAGYWMLSISYAAEVTTGFADPAALYGPLALLAMVATPLLGRTRAVGGAAAPTFAAVVVGTVGAVLLPLYSAERPQHLNIRYVADADSGTARWMIDSPNRPPAALRRLHELTPQRGPGLSRRRLPSAPAPYLAAAPPEAEVLEDVTIDGKRRLALLLRSPRHAPVVTLALPEGARVTAAAWQGHDLALESEEQRLFTFHGLPVEGARLELTVTADSPIDGAILFDVRYQLPAASAPLVQARGDLGVPVQRGDVWIVTRELTFGPAAAFTGRGAAKSSDKSGSTAAEGHRQGRAPRPAASSAHRSPADDTPPPATRPVGAG